MAGKMVEEVIVEGHEKIGETQRTTTVSVRRRSFNYCLSGRKRVNDDKDAHPAKRAKVDGNEAAGCRNLGTKLQIDKGEGEELKQEIDRIREVLEDDPKKLRKKEVEDVILYLNVNEIISLALKSDRANRGACNEYDHLEGGLSFAPSYGKVLGLLTFMVLCGVDKLEEGDLYILYQNLPKMAFAQLLLNALRSNTCFDKMEEERVVISKLCYALPWKLFAHIMHHKTSLPQFKSSKEEESNRGECTDVQKRAADSCEICAGKGKHSGLYGYHCSFWDSVPSGSTVGPSHRVCCRECKAPKRNYFVQCHCGSRIGQAVPCSVLWKL